MQVILLERVEKLGQLGQVVDVKAGFARNFLLPQRKALRATKKNMEGFEQNRGQLEATNVKRRDEAGTVSSKMAGQKIVIIRQASESDQLYGSVTARDVAIALGEAGFKIDRNQVQRDRPIKTLGLHQVRVALHPEVVVDITVNVARSVEEAELQAGGKRPGDEAARAEEQAALLAAESFFEPGAGLAAAPDEENEGSA